MFAYWHSFRMALQRSRWSAGMMMTFLIVITLSACWRLASELPDRASVESRAEQVMERSLIEIGPVVRSTTRFPITPR
ncbi:MAG: hypothetical protein SynsKO_42240 [Synoicihabitans sp.]